MNVSLVWVPGTWTNREYDQPSRYGTPFKLSGPNDPVLAMLHPKTPIDPEGNVAWWMADNWNPRVWYLVQVYAHRDSFHPSMGRVRTTRHYEVELNPLFHLGWSHWGYNEWDSVLAGVIATKFRPREGTELRGHIRDDSRNQKYPFTFRYRKELIRTTRI
jgi:hypothetical protein